MMCDQNQQYTQVPHQNRLFGTLIIFVGSAVIGATMLMMVATMLLADWVGSLLIALAILGGGFSLVALMIYAIALRARLHKIQSDLAQIAHIVRILQSGYSHAVSYLARLVQLLF